VKITALLKGWLVEHAQVDETASDDTIKAAVAEALTGGKLTAEKLIELTAEPEPEPDLAESVAGAVTETIEPLAKQVADLEAKLAAMQDEKPQDANGELVKQIAALAKSLQPPKANEKPADSEHKAASVLNPGGDDKPRPGTKADVIPVDKMYSTTRSALYYGKDHTHFAGQPVIYGRSDESAGVPLDSRSALDKAVCAAYFKKAAGANNTSGRGLPRWLQMTDHDKALWDYAVHECEWTGIVGKGSRDDATVDAGSAGQHAVYDTKLSPWQQKALLDDSTSGGLEAAPVVFDQAVITTPLLYGEIFPLVSVVPVARGRRMEGFTVSNPSFTSGTAEGTAISLFNTASMVGAFDTTIYNAVGAMEIGQDFEADSPVNMGQLVIQRYGEAAKNWLDNQLVNGDGTTEIQGIANASATVDIGNPSGGANAAPQPDDYIALAFNVVKQYRRPENRCVYVANDTSYQRARSIAVGASDERRVFGHDVAGYRLFEWPYKIENNMANTLAFFCAWRYYRLYRRLGLTVRVETGGKELAQKNLTLVVVRMRWGGKLELGAACSYSDNWQT
jgi:HK97 family phage major capsid protein